MTDQAYVVQRMSAPPGMRARIDSLAALHAGGSPGRALLGGLIGIGFVVAVVFGIIGMIDLVFDVIDRGHWLVLAIGSTLMVTPLLLMHVRDARLSKPGLDAAAAALRDQAAMNEVLRHTLRRDARHWFVEHEHGVIHVSPADDARTLYLDLSSVSDDPRHEEWFAKGLLDHALWTWFTTPDGRFLLGFEADGAAVPANSLEGAAGAYDPDTGGDLFEFLGSPADGDVIERSFAEVDAFLRARIAPR